MKTKLIFELPIEFKKSGKYFVIGCPPLDVFTQGETREKAKANISQALKMFLGDCFERGTLDRVMKESGFVLLKGPGSKQAASNRHKENISIDLPFEITHLPNECRA